MAESVGDPLIGKVLNGRFQIVSPLGTGGMGKVYKAIQQPLDRVVALKVLNPRYDSSKDPGFERRFFLEASMTAKLKHPNTITVHDYGRTDDGIYFIAMEYLEGETLHQVLGRDGPLSWQRALIVGAQVARSLREAHKLGLVHRDLKPANVMLLNEGTGGDVVKVLDFGLVKSFTPDAAPSDTELTQAGVLMGSPLYMAPEQARNEADPRTDIYALGVLLFQCVTGRPPFVGKESIDIIVRHIKEKPPQLRSLVPDVPLEMNAIVMKCLEKDPAARFQSMDELLDAMRAATAGQGLSGIFADPRTFSGGVPRTSSSQVPRTSSSQVVKPPPLGPAPATPDPGPTRAEGGPRSLELEIVESGVMTAPNRSRQAVIGVLVVIGIVVGGLAAWKLASHPVEPAKPLVAKPLVVKPVDPKQPDKHPDPVKPVDPKQPVEPPHVVAVAPVHVKFNVRSEPAGATVLRDGVNLGKTPLSFDVEHPPTQDVKTELKLYLDGYVPATVTAQGSSGEVDVKKDLVRKKAVGKNPKDPKNNDTGYKDDPYQ